MATLKRMNATGQWEYIQLTGGEMTELIANMGDLTLLTTTDKASVVNAINEVKATSSVNPSDYLAVGYTTVTDGNLCIDPSKTYYCTSSGTNVPSATYEWFVTVQIHANGNLHQTWNSFNPALTAEIYHRTRTGGTWYAFSRVWTNTNLTSLQYQDTRSTDISPVSYPGLSAHLKLNTTDGLADGGQYHGIVHVTQWNDVSGGQMHQLGFTDNGNLWMRTSTSVIAWGAWTRIWTSANFGVRTNWNTKGMLPYVTGQLAWKNYGDGHSIFDASAGTSPDGGAVNNTNAQVAWTGSYPTLMGWNGANTYGVRVDSARTCGTQSTSAPSGGVNGDIWHTYA